MIVKTKAIVLTSVKYGEADLIVKCLTQLGTRSYMLRGIFGSKSKKIKTAYFQPLSLLEITAKHNNKGSLNSIREVGAAHIYQSLGTNIYKQSIALFLAEILSVCLREEEENPSLFEYIEAAFLWLDSHSEIANFHLLFLVRLTRHLGFYPDIKNPDAPYFDLKEGSFSSSRPFGHYLDGEQLLLFKSLIGIKFDDIPSLKWNAEKRQVLLDALLDYYQWHVPGFNKPKSLKVLKEVFNEIS
jgi:DNA repair protein RecO (recombination protein O)